jgi:hypothetical protein
MKKYLLLLLLPGFTLLQYCSSSKKAKAPAATVAIVNFDDHVKPLVNSKCGPCHTVGNKTHIGIYKEAVEHADDIIRRINLTPGEKDFMPAKHDKLSDSVIAVFAKWKADGLLEKANP